MTTQPGDTSGRPGDVCEFLPQKRPPTEERPPASQAARLEAIRGLVDSGDYQVPAMAVAERMLHLIKIPRRDPVGSSLPGPP